MLSLGSLVKFFLSSSQIDCCIATHFILPDAIIHFHSCLSSLQDNFHPRFQAATRPSYVYQSITSLIGKDGNHPAVKLYRQRFPYHNLTYNESTGQLVFHHPEGMSFTVEELVAMLLEYARNVAEYHSGLFLFLSVLCSYHLFLSTLFVDTLLSSIF